MSQSEKVIDVAKTAAGKTEQVLGTDSMKTDGKRLETEAKTDHTAQQAQQKSQGVLDSAIGTVKDTVGGLFGSSSTQTEGKAEKAKGAVEQKSSSL